MTENAGVLGTGTMGAGIVQVAAQVGHSVMACDLSADSVEKGRSYVRDGLSRFAAKAIISEGEAKAASRGVQ